MFNVQFFLKRVGGIESPSLAFQANDDPFREVVADVEMNFYTQTTPKLHLFKCCIEISSFVARMIALSI